MVYIKNIFPFTIKGQLQSETLTFLEKQLQKNFSPHYKWTLTSNFSGMFPKVFKILLTYIKVGLYSFWWGVP